MTLQEKLLKIGEIIERDKKKLRTDFSNLEATIFFQHNQDVYEKMINAIEEVQKE